MTFQNVMDCFISKKWSIGFHPHSRQVESLNYSLRKLSKSQSLNYGLCVFLLSVTIMYSLFSTYIASGSVLNISNAFFPSLNLHSNSAE